LVAPHGAVDGRVNAQRSDGFEECCSIEPAQNLVVRPRDGDHGALCPVDLRQDVVVFIDVSSPDAETPARRPVWVKVAVGAAVVVALVVAASRPVRNPEFVASGPPIVTPAGGALADLSADEFEGVLVGLRGTPVIVNIWASWCSPCRTEMPLLERTWRQRTGDVMILGVASKDDVPAARAFMSEFDVTYPNVFDGSGDIRRRLGLRGFPTTYVFDRDGALRTTIVGGLSEQRLASVIEDITA
jgi:cytochrome c biogenesis protein CcmG/thiol:disulfide interchange protein DsbE